MTVCTGRSAIAGASLLVLALAGCNREPEGWTPVLEQTSTAFLKTETEEIASRVRLAQADLPVNPEKAAAELAEAEDGLDHLLTYYLPVLDARERAYNAYRHYELGRSKETERELDEVEPILLAIAESGHGHLLRAMEEPLETLEDARAALDVDSDEATEALRTLATRLNFLLLRGGLVLNE
ncbi:MAG: hypothetical protein ACE5GX_12120 [Thermoanaerobaculia bacterium]